MKITRFIPLLIVFFLSCCTGINKSEKQSEIKIVSLDGTTQQILVTNYGYYLFNWIPLGSGGEENNSFSLFSDHVNLDSAMKSFNEECKKLGAVEIANVQAKPFSTCYFSWIPYFGTTFGLYWYKEIQVSGVVSIPTIREYSQDENL